MCVDTLHTFIQTCLSKSLLMIYVCFINVCTLLDGIRLVFIEKRDSSGKLKWAREICMQWAGVDWMMHGRCRKFFALIHATLFNCSVS